MLLVVLVELYGASSAVCKVGNTGRNLVVKVEGKHTVRDCFMGIWSRHATGSKSIVERHLRVTVWAKEVEVQCFGVCLQPREEPIARCEASNEEDGLGDSQLPRIAMY